MVAQTVAEARPRRRPSPVWALLWEEWRQTRTSLLAGTGLALLALTATLASSGWAITPYRNGDEYQMCMLLLGLLLLWQVGTLLFSGYGRNDLSLSFPRRLYTLPVSSVTLPLVRIGYGAAVVGVTFGLLNLFVRTSGYPFGSAVRYAAVAVQVLLYAQAVAWTLGRRPVAAFVVLVVGWAPFAVVYASIARLRADLEPTAFAVAAVSTSLLFAAAAVAGVIADRRGSGIGKTLGLGFAALLGRPLRREGDPLVPPTPKRAQFGYEWHRRTRPTLWIALGTGIATALFYCLLIFAGKMAYIGPEGVLLRFHELVVTFLSALTATGTLVGLLSAGIAQRLIDERERISGLGRFVAVRPQGTAAIAAARLKALASGTAIVQVAPFLLLALLVAPTDAGARFIYDFVFNRMHHPGIFTVGVLWILLGWSLLTMPLTSCLVFLAVVNTAESTETALERGRTIGFTHWMPMLVILLAVAAWGLWKAVKARRLGLVSDRKLLILAAAWLLTAGLLYAGFGHNVFPASGTPLLTGLATVVATAVAGLVPYLPFVTVPLAVHRQRHR